MNAHSETKHAPWINRLVINGRIVFAVAEVDVPYIERTLAAAPELLEALEAISAAWPAHGSNVQNKTADAMAERARAALAKVRP